MTVFRHPLEELVLLGEADNLQDVSLPSDALALSKPSRDARRRCDLNEANLLQTVTRGVVAALSKPSRDARRRCDLNEANLLQTVTRGVVTALTKPILSTYQSPATTRLQSTSIRESVH